MSEVDYETCLPECRYEERPPEQQGRGIPPAIHADGCPHAGDYRIYALPTPVQTDP